MSLEFLRLGVQYVLTHLANTDLKSIRDFPPTFSVIYYEELGWIMDGVEEN